jgi:protein ImuB
VVERLTRVACVWVDAFAAAAAERAEPALREHAMAVVTGAAPATRVVEANAAARERGIRAGMPEAEAVARCPELIRRPTSPACVDAARRALLDACYGVSPRIEDAAPGLVHVDVAGLGRLIGDDAAVAERLRRAGGAVGLPPRVGVAGTRTAARIAARAGLGSIATRDEAQALATVPISALEWPEDIAHAFARWGVATLGELAALPRGGLSARLGAPGLAAHDLARGVDDPRPWQSWSPPPFWEEAQELDWEIDALGPLVAVLARVVDRLTARLSAAYLVADELELRLALAGGGHDARTLALACPMDAPRPLLTLVEHDLAARPPHGAVTAVAVQARAIPRRAVSGELGRSAPPAERDLATVLARLVTLVGADAVGAVALADSHRPDAFVPARLELDSRPDTRAERREPGDTVLALRRLRPPRRVSVITDGERRPAVVYGALAPEARVVGCAGPWRVSGEWWDAEAWARDEWDVALSDRAVCRLARDLVSAEWYLDGVYD